MGLFEQLPYTNFHELNLDWFLDKFKELLKEWADMQTDFTDLTAAVNSLREYVANYFANLDVQDEVNKKLDEMAESGELAAAIASYADNIVNTFYFPDLNGTTYYSANFCILHSFGKIIIFDTGSNGNWIPCKNLLDELVASGVLKNIDYIILSHYHFDHVDNLGKILEQYPHAGVKVYIPMNPVGYMVGPSDETAIISNYNRVISTLQTYAVDYTEVTEDTRIEYTPGNSYIDLWNSTHSDYTYYHDNSPAIYNNFSMTALVKMTDMYAFFPGDIQRQAQIRLMETHDVPKVEIYSAHHHGIQNDDYIPYLNAIEPHWIVVQTSGWRINVSAASSFVSNYYTDYTKLLTTAFGKVTLVSFQNGSALTEGKVLTSMGQFFSYVDIYVDNESPTLGDGTIDNPVNSIETALMLCNSNSLNVQYNIFIKPTTTEYPRTYIRERQQNIILNKWPATEGKPTIEGLYITACGKVELHNLIINGGIDTYTCSLFVQYSNIYVADCEFNFSGENWSGITTSMCEVYLYNNIFNGSGNFASAVKSYRYGTCITNGNTLRCPCGYSAVHQHVIIRGKDTWDGSQNYILASTGSVPFLVEYGLASDVLALCWNNSGSAISYPFYDGNNTFAIIQGSHKRVLTST